MGWSRFWSERARIAAERRRHRYGVEAPTSLKRAVLLEPVRIGFGTSLKMMGYVLIGSPLEPLRLFWQHLSDQDTPKRRRKIQEMAGDLRWRVSKDCRMLEGSYERSLFSRDLAKVPLFMQKLLHRTQPLLVVQPTSAQDIENIVGFAVEHSVPVFCRGAGSWAFGGAVPTRNGIVIDLSSMREVFDVDPKEQTVVVQPGARWSDLALKLEPLGLTPVTTPSSRFSTIGGWAATGGLGLEGYKYGHFSQAVHGGTVVRPDGSTVHISQGDPELADYLGTEGQLGLFTELKLQVRSKSKASLPRLLFFNSAKEATGFIEKLIDSEHAPSHVAFVDRHYMTEQNILFADKTGQKKPIFKAQDSVLLHFDDKEAENKFDADNEIADSYEQSKGIDARLLWTERFFPLKAQRLGPSLLACELLVPIKALPETIDQFKSLAKWFGVTLAVESIVSKTAEGIECVTIASFPCDSSRNLDYYLRLTLVQLLTRIGVRLGARPYGFGIWNAPFMETGGNKGARAAFKRKKQAADPHHLLNPLKYYRFKTRFFNLPGQLFKPWVLNTALTLMQPVVPLMGMLARLLGKKQQKEWALPPAEKREGYDLLSQTALRCTHCGACIAACPAYFLTKDELVTGRSKLQQGQCHIESGEIRKREAQSLFQCLRCGLCEEVCQTRLPLRDCYEIVEKWAEDGFGKPETLIQEFIMNVDENRAGIVKRFGLKAALWSNETGRWEKDEKKGGRA